MNNSEDSDSLIPKKTVGQYVCSKCGMKMPNARGIINMHVCKGIVVSAERPELEDDKKKNEEHKRETFIDILENAMKTGINDIALDVGGIIINGKVTKLDKEKQHITIRDIFNQYHILTFECVKKSFII